MLRNNKHGAAPAHSSTNKILKSLSEWGAQTGGAKTVQDTSVTKLGAHGLATSGDSSSLVVSVDGCAASRGGVSIH